MRIVVTSTLTYSWDVSSPHQAISQAKSLKFENPGEKGSWLHLSFLLSCSFFSSPILLTCFWSFQDLELEEGNFVDSQNSCLMLWKWSHCLLDFADVGSWFLSQGLSWVPQRTSLSHVCSIKVIQQQFISSFHPLPPWSHFDQEQSITTSTPFPLGIHLVHRKHHLPRQTLRMQLLSHTSVLRDFQFLQCEPVNRPVSFKCKEAHVKLCRWFHQSPVLWSEVRSWSPYLRAESPSRLLWWLRW